MNDWINETNDNEEIDELEHEIHFSWQCKCGELNEDYWNDAQEKHLWRNECDCGRYLELLVMPKKG